MSFCLQVIKSTHFRDEPLFRRERHDNALTAGNLEDNSCVVGFPFPFAARHWFDSRVGADAQSPQRGDQALGARWLQRRRNYDQIDVAVFIGIATRLGAKEDRFAHGYAGFLCGIEVSADYLLNCSCNHL